MAGWIERHRPLLRVLFWLVAYVSAVATFVALRKHSLLFAVLAVFAIAATARSLHATVRREMPADLSLPARLVRIVPLPLVGIGLLVASLALGDGWAFFGLALLYVGLGLGLEALREVPGLAEKLGPVVLGGSVGIAALGVVVMAVVHSAWGTRLLVAGLLIAPVGIGLVSSAALRAADRDAGSPRTRRAMALAGPVLFVVGMVGLLLLGLSAPYALLAGGSLLVLVVAIAARSNADVVLVIALAAVVWTLASRTVPLSDPFVVDHGETVMVALGDSYISGEGADEFFEGTNDKGVSQCRRAPTAYPALLVIEHDPPVPPDLAYLACSGADTDGVRQQLTELRQLQADTDMHIALVLLSVGGNDGLFGTIGRTCLLPGSCEELAQAWADNLDVVASRLAALYTDVRAAVGDAPVLVVPYPVPIAPTGCAYSGFSDAEHRFLDQFTRALDDVITHTATAAGFQVVDTVPGAFERANARLCDGSPGQVGVNFLAANSVFGTLEQSVNPLNWFHNSLHPNEKGHELLRGALRDWLDAHPDLSVTTPPPTTAPVTVEGGDRCRGRTGDDLQACIKAWSRQQTGRALLVSAPMLMLITLGAWLMALALIRLWWLLFRDPAQPPSTAL